MTIKLDAQTRDANQNLGYLRKQGLMPAICYGSKNIPAAISVDANTFSKIFKEAGESTTITLNLPTGPVQTLIHDVEMDPVKKQPIHADFLIIDIKKPVHVAVPLEFEGVSEAVKTGGGILVKVLHEIEIEALPKDLPHSISVDISKLQTLEDHILAGDLVLPKGVSLKTKESEIVASISVQKEEAEESSPSDLSSIEVEKKGKKDEEVSG